MKKVFRLSVAGVMLAILLTSIESGAEAYLRDRGRMAYFASHRPPAYAHSSFYSPEFMAEQATASDSYTIDEYGDEVSEFHGQWYNFDKGHRRTIGPDTAPHTLYFLGASTVSSLEVPDALTLPSQLQALIGDRYRVINLGQGGYYATRELQHLKRLSLKPGDIVIFYDGVIEATAYGGDAREQTWYGQACNWIQGHLPRLAIGKLGCRYADMTLPILLGNTQIGRLYREALQKASAYTNAHGATFYHFVQPILWSKPLSKDEMVINNNPFLIDGSWRSEVLGGWSQIQAGHKTASVDGTDLTHLLDSIRDENQTVYFDFDHINESGNAIAARAIADAIAPTF